MVKRTVVLIINIYQNEMEEKLTIEIEEADLYLVAYVSGSLTLKSGKDLIDVIAHESKRRGYDLFLVDMLQTGPPQKEIDRYYLGEYAALTLHDGLKLAVVYPEKFINKFFENTAVNRGVEVTVVGNREKALEWLFK